ncbi:alpha/beta fold hydrolase [Sanguibacter antarcticus]|uniref:alpha/beta fold hydrolase n=1 Tax=Sanguibacter antarcticus TaxID=372484 RepID=UPI001FE50312|nr:alpha/beta fold hydrolase [Sanguibacter antarcticus]
MISASNDLPVRAALFSRRRTAGPQGWVRFATVLAGASLVLAGCSSPGSKTQSTVDGPSASGSTSAPEEDVAADLVEFYDQDVDWAECGSTFECADVSVPLDWDAPSDGAITVGVRRHLADGVKMGTVLINPGGPGGSGVNFVGYAPFIFGDALLESYDILGFDPRGVGESSPVTCLTDEEKDVYNAKSYVPDDAGLAAMEADSTYIAGRCAEETGDVLGEVDTQSSARDMDVIRAVVGDAQLNYLGFSYGTQLGATYAGIYPAKVGRMVLDGAIDLRLSVQEQSLQQAVGFENALTAYVEDCQAGSGCPLTGTATDGKAQVKTLLDGLLANPMPTDDSERPLTQTLAFYGIAQPLYAQSMWPLLTTALEAAIVAGDGSELLESADSYNSREPDGTYSDNQGEAFRAIGCLDARGETDRATMDAEYAAIVAAAPTMGTFFGYGGLGCKNWPYPEVAQDFDLAATGAAPIVVIGTTNDPATPYVWAQGLAEQLESGVLVTYEGEGHTAYGRSNSCIIDAVDGYFVDGAVPDDGLMC